MSNKNSVKAYIWSSIYLCQQSPFYSVETSICHFIYRTREITDWHTRSYVIIIMPSRPILATAANLQHLVHKRFCRHRCTHSYFTHDPKGRIFDMTGKTSVAEADFKKLTWLKNSYLRFKWQANKGDRNKKETFDE